MFLGEIQDAFLEIGRVLRIGLPPTLLERRNLASLAILFGRLLFPTTANFKLLGNERCVHAVIDDAFTNAGDIVLLQRHLTLTNKWGIALAKLFPDSTIR